tara:strand:- start:787 stop:2370 length:1584 start_codon:yes stop_codon:yes gene_type:complete
MSNLLRNLERATNETLTENGALTHQSTLNKCLDLFSRAGGLRNDPVEALNLFKNAYAEDPVAAVITLFYIRDIRGGMGERLIFRVCMDWLLDRQPSMYRNVVSCTPEFGRWDDVVRHYHVNKDLVKNQIREDVSNTDALLPCSLLAKWMPSISASNDQQKLLAKEIASDMGMTQRLYRKMLAKLRRHIDIVEHHMCQQNWKDIDFSKVPSQAMLKLKGAFWKNQPERFKEYIESVEKGEEKINAGTITPDQLIKPYVREPEEYKDPIVLDPVIEEQWKALPTWGEPQNMLVVADVSYSMYWAETRPIDIAISLALYASERNANPLWQNTFMTFDSTPQLMKVNRHNTLLEKVQELQNAPWGGSTNLQKAIDLIIDSCEVEADLPDSLVIISDMEFDHATTETTNFDAFKQKAEAKGFKLPNIVFWNVDSRSRQSPVTFDERGVALVSGRSPSILQMAFDGNFDPMSFYQEAVLNNRRYKDVKRGAQFGNSCWADTPVADQAQVEPEVTLPEGYADLEFDIPTDHDAT